MLTYNGTPETVHFTNWLLHGEGKVANTAEIIRRGRGRR